MWALVELPRARRQPSAVDVNPDAGVRRAAFILKHGVGASRNFQVSKFGMRIGGFYTRPVGELGVFSGSELGNSRIGA